MQITPRNIDFSIADLPRYWFAGQRALTLYLNNLSLAFPSGETFFVTSVKAHQNLVKDPALQAAVQAFCAQEGYHRREHSRINALLQAQGYPANEIELRLARGLRFARRMLPLRTQLAATAALEHFTALMGQGLLDDPRWIEGAHPRMQELWRWHALEEVEHKAVAFDVYQAAGGNYVERTLVMLLVSTVFWVKVIEQQIRLMAADRILFNAREWWSLFRHLFVAPGTVRVLARGWLRWFSPSFHPDGQTRASTAHLGDAGAR